MKFPFLAMLIVGCSSIQPGSPIPDAEVADRPAQSTGSLVDVALAAGDAKWRVDGLAIEGAAEPLHSIAGHNAHWFAWSAFHPGTPVFEREAIVDSPIIGNAQCTVPCDQIVPECGGRDCIPSLESPVMVPVGDPGLDYLWDEDEVIGVITADGPRAYPHNILWWHEVINDAVGDRSFTVTLCPLTGSGVNFDRSAFIPGEIVELGVSGSLYNANLTLCDRTSESFWSQMRVEAASGPRVGTPAPILPSFEMAWAQWRSLHPDTLAVSGNTGHMRDYRRNPLGNYRNDHDNTFRQTDPPPDPAFLNKDMVFGLFTPSGVKAYPWAVLEQTVGARRGIVQDQVQGISVLIVFDLDARFVHAFDRTMSGEVLEFALEN